MEIIFLLWKHKIFIILTTLIITVVAVVVFKYLAPSKYETSRSMIGINVSVSDFMALEQQVKSLKINESFKKNLSTELNEKYSSEELTEVFRTAYSNFITSFPGKDYIFNINRTKDIEYIKNISLKTIADNSKISSIINTIIWDVVKENFLKNYIFKELNTSYEKNQDKIASLKENQMYLVRNIDLTEKQLKEFRTRKTSIKDALDNSKQPMVLYNLGTDQQINNFAISSETDSIDEFISYSNAKQKNQMYHHNPNYDYLPLEYQIKMLKKPFNLFEFRIRTII